MALALVRHDVRRVLRRVEVARRMRGAVIAT
jgi:hypothetical protein